MNAVLIVLAVVAVIITAVVGLGYVLAAIVRRWFEDLEG